MPFEKVWGLLVDGSFDPGLAPAEPHALTIRSGDPRVDVQSALAMLAPEWGLRQLIDIPERQARDDLARASVMALSFVAQSARGPDRPPVPQDDVDRGTSIPERFLIRWRGEADPDHVKAIDAYWISAAEHGMNASTFTARVIASTGADVAAALSGAVGALSGPLHGGAPSRVLHMLDEVEQLGDAERWVKSALDRGDRLMGFGHRVYRAEDPRARVLRRTARELGSPRYEVAEALEAAALAELQGPQARPRARHQRRVLVGGDPRPGRRPVAAVHPDVRLRAHGRLGGAHPRAEARGPADPPDGEVRRPAAPAAERADGRAARDDRVAAHKARLAPEWRRSTSWTPRAWEITSIACTARRGRCAGRARRPRTSCRTRSRASWRGRASSGATTTSATCCASCATPSSRSGAPPGAGPWPRESRPRSSSCPTLVAPPSPRRPRARARSSRSSPRCREDFRDAITAIDVVGLSYAEAARALRVREGTVTSRLYRARAQVAKALRGGT